MVEAIKQNFPQAEIAESSFRYQSEVEARQRLIVGVNAYTIEQDEPIPLHTSDPRLEIEQIERVKALRARRDAAVADRCLVELGEAAGGTTNLVPVIIRAAKADVTMGEMCDVLREVWGTWRETPVY
jgi:methylmalonyl-CoA mutase N-terminal domain/subunit